MRRLCVILTDVSGRDRFVNARPCGPRRIGKFQEGEVVDAFVTLFPQRHDFGHRPVSLRHVTSFDFHG